MLLVWPEGLNGRAAAFLQRICRVLTSPVMLAESRAPGSTCCSTLTENADLTLYT